MAVDGTDGDQAGQAADNKATAVRVWPTADEAEDRVGRTTRLLATARMVAARMPLLLQAAVMEATVVAAAAAAMAAVELVVAAMAAMEAKIRTLRHTAGPVALATADRPRLHTAAMLLHLQRETPTPLLPHILPLLRDTMAAAMERRPHLEEARTTPTAVLGHRRVHTNNGGTDPPGPRRQMVIIGCILVLDCANRAPSSMSHHP